MEDPARAKSCSSQALAEHEEEIPGTVRPAQLIKDLAKEIRLVEVSMGQQSVSFLFFALASHSVGAEVANNAKATLLFPIAKECCSHKTRVLKASYNNCSITLK